MGNCEEIEIIDNGLKKEDYLTIIFSIAGGLIAIIIALSITVYCLRKKYKVRMNLENIKFCVPPK